MAARVCGGKTHAFSSPSFELATGLSWYLAGLRGETVPREDRDLPEGEAEGEAEGARLPGVVALPPMPREPLPDSVPGLESGLKGSSKGLNPCEVAGRDAPGNGDLPWEPSKRTLGADLSSPAVASALSLGS